MTCPRCNGRGRYYRERTVIDQSSSFARFWGTRIAYHFQQLVKCRLCEGTGEREIGGES